jgi:hypothetical protein
MYIWQSSAPQLSATRHCPPPEAGKIHRYMETAGSLGAEKWWCHLAFLHATDHCKTKLVCMYPVLSDNGVGSEYTNREHPHATKQLRALPAWRVDREQMPKLSPKKTFFFCIPKIAGRRSSEVLALKQRISWRSERTHHPSLRTCPHSWVRDKRFHTMDRRLVAEGD